MRAVARKNECCKITTIMQVECSEVYHPIMDEFKKEAASEGA